VTRGAGGPWQDAAGYLGDTGCSDSTRRQLDGRRAVSLSISSSRMRVDHGGAQYLQSTAMHFSE